MKIDAITRVKNLSTQSAQIYQYTSISTDTWSTIHLFQIMLKYRK